jgi:hypothetical protein
MSPLLKQEYSQPGRYSVELPLLPPDSFLLVIGMTDEHGQYFEVHLRVAITSFSFYQSHFPSL